MMRLRTPRLSAPIAGVAAGCLVLGLATPAAAQPPGTTAAVPPPPQSATQFESLDRGLIAVRTADGVFLSWRLLGSEATGAGETGMLGPDFAVYRDGVKLAVVSDSTNFADPSGTSESTYTVAPIVNDIELAQSASAQPWADGYYDLPLKRPADGITPTGEAFSYKIDNLSVADIDGDGALEYVVKWDPTNEKDVSIKGYTGTVYIDTYEFDGTLLNRIDLGVNVRAGAHYTQFLVYDFDGDGRAETMLKTAPGTKSVRYMTDGSVENESFVTLPAADIAAGVTHQKDYRLSAAGYAEYLVGEFQKWSEHPEVVAGHWPATLEEAWGVPVTHSYPLSEADARELVTYFLDVYAPSRSTRNDLRKFEGFVLESPEYLTVFDSVTGAELQTIPYTPAREDDGLRWGDYAMSRIEPGNRVDRFLSGVAYLDGAHPSAIFSRGYYTRAAVVAFDWDGERLTERWNADSGWVPMTNPFKDTPHGRDGVSEEWGTLATQGFHSLSAADVDGDGKHEIVYGAATLDDDGSLLYSSFAALPEGSAAPGTIARLGHGDALSVTDIDPSRPGLEIFTVHESASMAPYGMALRDAATGEVLFGAYSGTDTAKGTIGDMRPDVPGIEMWATMPKNTALTGLVSAKGQVISAAPKNNMPIHFAADMTTQIVNWGNTPWPGIDDHLRGRLFDAVDTKDKESLVADILGDWREELVYRRTDNNAIRIYSSTEVTTHKLTTLLHDKQYRAEVARQQTGYNFPTFPSFYFANDMSWSQVPIHTVAATPARPLIEDRGRFRPDEIQIPADPAFDYYVDGAIVPAGTIQVSPGRHIVSAVQKPWIRPADGATTTWRYPVGRSAAVDAPR